MRIFSLQLRYRGEGEGELFEYVGCVPTFQEMRPLFERELRRARRYERPLSLLILSLTEDHSSPPLSTARQLQFLHLSTLLRDTLRESDMACYAAETQEFIALLPEATLAAAEQAAERIQRLLRQRHADGLRVLTAEYPAAGLTLPDLLTAARSVAADPTITPIPRVSISG